MTDVFVHSPSKNISCFCCGSLQEVVKDREVTHTSPEENLRHTEIIDQIKAIRTARESTMLTFFIFV